MAQVPHALSRDRVVAVNFLLLFCWLAFGALALQGRVNAAGDELSNLNPATWRSEFEYLENLYKNWGQVGIGLLIVPWRLFRALFQFNPDSFPWWIPISINLYLITATALNAVAASRLIVGFSSPIAALVGAGLGVFWLLNTTTLGLAVEIPITFLAAYTLPPYLIFLALLLLARNSLAQSRRVQAIATIALLAASANTPTYPLSMPVIFCAGTLAMLLAGRLRLRSAARLAASWVVLAALGAIFLWTTPGFHARGKLLGLASPSLRELLERLPEWYTTSLNLAYFALFSDRVPNPVLLHGIVLAGVFLGLTMHCARMLLRSRSNAEVPNARCVGAHGLNSAVMAAGYLGAFHATTIPLLVTPYFPEYTRVYPALLLALGLAHTLIWMTMVLSAFLSTVQQRNFMVRGVSYATSNPTEPSERISWGWALLIRV